MKPFFRGFVYFHNLFLFRFLHLLAVWQLRLAWDMEEHIILMEDTAIPTEAPKDYLDMDTGMGSARGLLMLSQVLVMEELTILMEDPAIPTEVSRDLQDTTLDMDMDMDSTSVMLSPATLDMVQLLLTIHMAVSAMKLEAPRVFLDTMVMELVRDLLMLHTDMVIMDLALLV